ncbi:biotin/lipoyl-binding protein, partial [Pseudomonas aeruginosa]
MAERSGRSACWSRPPLSNRAARRPAKEGDLLLRIDPRPYRDALAQARASLIT